MTSPVCSIFVTKKFQCMKKLDYLLFGAGHILALFSSGSLVQLVLHVTPRDLQINKCLFLFASSLGCPTQNNKPNIHCLALTSIFASLYLQHPLLCDELLETEGLIVQRCFPAMQLDMVYWLRYQLPG